MSRLYAPQSELAVLSSFLNRLDQGWLGHIDRTVKDSEQIFSDPKNKAIYKTAKRLSDQGKHPDLSIIIDSLDNNYSSLFDDGAQEYVMQVQLTAPITTLDQFTSSLQSLDQLRQMRSQVKNLEKVLQEINMDDSEREEKSKTNREISSDPLTPVEISQKLMDIAASAEVVLDTQTFGSITQQILDSKQAAWTQTTGIELLDNVLGGGGFESGCLTIVAARPKVGKTIFLNSMTHTMLDGGAYPIVLNYETKDVEFVAKMIARHIAGEDGPESDINWGLIKRKISKEEVALTKRQIDRINEGIEWAKEQDWFVSFDKNMSMQDIEALVQKERARRDEDAKIVLFVDYLQLQVMNAFKEREEITQLTRFYKKLAGTYKIAVVCLSQMNRDGSDNMEVKNLRGSGSIEQDADTIIMLDRPSRRDPDQPKYILEVFAGTTRLAEGENFSLFIDGGTNLIADMSEELMDLNTKESDIFTDLI